MSKYFQATIMVPIKQEFPAPDIEQAQKMARALTEQFKKEGDPAPFLHTMIRLDVPQPKKDAA